MLVLIGGVASVAYIGHAVVWNVLAGTVRQAIVPGPLLGRVGAVGRLSGYLGLTIGAAAGGLGGGRGRGAGPVPGRRRTVRRARGQVPWMLRNAVLDRP